MFTLQVMEKAHLVIGFRIADQRQESKAMLNYSPCFVHQLSLVDELDCRPHCNGRKGIEDLLHAFVKLPDILDRQAGVIDLKCARKVGLPEVSHSPILEVQVFEGPLEGSQVCTLGADGEGTQVVHFVPDKLLPERWLFLSLDGGF